MIVKKRHNQGSLVLLLMADGRRVASISFGEEWQKSRSTAAQLDVLFCYENLLFIGGIKISFKILGRYSGLFCYRHFYRWLIPSHPNRQIPGQTGSG